MKPITEQYSEKKEFPSGIWTKCKKCEHVFLKKDFEKDLFVCPKCGYYARLNAKKRIEITVDKGTFKEIAKEIHPKDFLKFPGYADKIDSGMADGIIAGECKIKRFSCVIVVMDFGFMGGSMGSVVGEKIVRAVEASIKLNIALIVFCASGGARMQEGIVSLMQMGKTSAALAKLSEKELPYISVLTDPTTGGVAASFAMLGDINIAEPKALIGFAGPRVIEQTLKHQLPEGFQSAEFLEKHGMVDIIVSRKNMRETLGKLLKFFS
ncbi:MAG: acetyl-CoA carboxylase, carboxyltransferase subunit beta [Elusimicrobiota bacterium]|jgi:acetyl-CoA carboxylase carboxyl transferase subunit beta|nr:acetyl-CoA carboxylase, carboxyltransferase subunit beta [Elusimicrobiota bacterium]